MRSVSIRLIDLPKITIPIGFAGENLYTRVQIDCKKVFDEYPNASVSLTIKPPKSVPYPAFVTRENDIVIWDVSNSDLTQNGQGEIQLTFSVDEIIVKSYIGKIKIERSLLPEGEAPDAIQDWITRANLIIDDIASEVEEQMDEYIDDTAGIGDTDKLWSADKIATELSNIESMHIHICTSGEYNEQRVPTIQNPDPNTIYLVPGGVSSNLYVEWIYVNNAWETLGSAQQDLSDYARKTDTVLNTTLSRGRKANTTVGNNSMAFGNNTEASGLNSVALGNMTIASGTCSYSEGSLSQATGDSSHAEGTFTFAQGNSAHSEGVQTSSDGCATHAEGMYTVAKGTGQHAQGSYNPVPVVYPDWVKGNSYEVGDRVTSVNGGFECLEAHSDNSWVPAHWKVLPSNCDTAFIIGNGYDGNHRSNAATIDFDGTTRLAGDVYVNCNGDSTGGTKLASLTDLNTKADKSDTVLDTTLSRGRKANTTIGQGSFAFGTDVEASGNYSFAEGEGTTATNWDGHAEGWGTTSNGVGSHAEGIRTIASGTGSHSEGAESVSIGMYAHSEGQNTSAVGTCSHSEGTRTIANGESSHVVGIFNIEDNYNNWVEWVSGHSYKVGDKVKCTSGNESKGYICKVANSDTKNPGQNGAKWTKRFGRMNFAEIVGNGVDENTRSNARTLDWEGNERLLGDLYVGANSDGTGGTKVAKVSEIPDVSTKADLGVIAPEYEDLNFPVFMLDNCIHEGKLYIALTDIQSAESWNVLHWTEIEGGLASEAVEALKNAMAASYLAQQKLNAPSSQGTAGQVLSLNNSLNPVWIDCPEFATDPEVQEIIDTYGLIQFKIDGMKYYSEPSMTWVDWFASEYKPTTGTHKDMVIKDDHVRYDNTLQAEYLALSGDVNPVLATSQIIEDALYGFS